MFLSKETDEEIFFIPAPFMTDANGNRSNEVHYEVKAFSNGKVYLTVVADPRWINAEGRAFPVTIDPQIMIPHAGALTTYGWCDGQMTSPSSVHLVGSMPVTVAAYSLAARNSSVSLLCDSGSDCENCESNSNTWETAYTLTFSQWMSESIVTETDSIWFKFTANSSACERMSVK